MKHMIDRNNLSLITNRQVVGPFRHVLCSDLIVNDCTVSNATKERSYQFPLKIFAERKQGQLLLETEKEERYNVSEDILRVLNETFGEKVTPEEVFYYVYSVLHSEFYRIQHRESLQLDFPRIPFASELYLFKKLTFLGKRLVRLHLLRSTELALPLARFPEKGDNLVEMIEYETEGCIVRINTQQFFEGVPQGVWNFRIGSYHVCEKWLKDRKGRTLSNDEILHYLKVVTAISETIEIQEEIDELYPLVEKRVILFQ